VSRRLVADMSEDQADLMTDIQKVISSYSADLTAVSIIGCLEYVKGSLLDMALDALEDMEHNE